MVPWHKNRPQAARLTSAPRFRRLSADAAYPYRLWACPSSRHLRRDLHGVGVAVLSRNHVLQEPDLHGLAGEDAQIDLLDDAIAPERMCASTAFSSGVINIRRYCWRIDVALFLFVFLVFAGEHSGWRSDDKSSDGEPAYPFHDRAPLHLGQTRALRTRFPHWKVHCATGTVT